MKNTATIRDFHAHLYFKSEAEKQQVLAVIGAVAKQFPDVQIGRVHDTPIGPHPLGMCLIAFLPEHFATVVPFLMLNCGQLSVLIHPETGDDIPDHTDHALWLGERLPIKLDKL